MINIALDVWEGLTEQDRMNIKMTAQRNYCRERKIPFFAGVTGKCFCCGKSVYADDGYSLTKCQTDIISGCPHCKASFVD